MYRVGTPARDVVSEFGGGNDEYCGSAVLQEVWISDLWSGAKLPLVSRGALRRIRDDEGIMTPQLFISAKVAAQPAAVADAAARPQDRCVFEAQNQANVVPIYQWRRS